MAKRVFSEREVEAAQCLWEAYIELQMGDSGTVPNEEADKFTELRSTHGSFLMRGVMRDLVADCELAWAAADALDPGNKSFDFDFCPTFLRGALESGVLDDKIAIAYGKGTPFTVVKA